MTKMKNKVSRDEREVVHESNLIDKTLKNVMNENGRNNYYESLNQ